MGKRSGLVQEARSHLVFVLWVVALGPAAFVAALVKVLGPDVGWLVLLRHYGVAVLHFLGYTVLCSLGLILYRRRGGSRLIGLPIMGGALALFVAVGLVFRSSATHFLHDAIVATVVLAVEQLYHRLVATRLEAEHRELERERQRRAALEARWNSLESRVRPHFLFNTLSSLRELVRRNAEEADAMIQRLAELLRFSARFRAPGHGAAGRGNAHGGRLPGDRADAAGRPAALGCGGGRRSAGPCRCRL